MGAWQSGQKNVCSSKFPSIKKNVRVGFWGMRCAARKQQLFCLNRQYLQIKSIENQLLIQK
jgi:hypothetical protein